MAPTVSVQKRETAAKAEQHAGGGKRLNKGARAGLAGMARTPAIVPEKILKDGNSRAPMAFALPVEKALNAGEKRQASFAQVLVFELRVRDAMTSPPITATPTDSLRSIQHLMKAHRISGVPILANDMLVGIVSIEDIISALDEGHINDPVEPWMSHKIVTLRDHFSLVRAVAEFDRHGFGRFPVLDANNRLVGVITRGDITVCLMHHLERRAEEALAKEAALVATRAADEKAHRVVVNTHVQSGDYDSAGKLSQRMRQVLARPAASLPKSSGAPPSSPTKRRPTSSSTRSAARSPLPLTPSKSASKPSTAVPALKTWTRPCRKAGPPRDACRANSVLARAWACPTSNVAPTSSPSSRNWAAARGCMRRYSFTKQETRL